MGKRAVFRSAEKDWTSQNPGLISTPIRTEETWVRSISALTELGI